MRIIVFDRDLHEPLTVVNIPHWLAEQAKAGMRVQLAPPPKQRASFDVAYQDIAEMASIDIKAVTLTFEPVFRGEGRTPIFWYAYADDPETALLLRCAYLPGQVGDVQRREAKAYVSGVFAGFGL